MPSNTTFQAGKGLLLETTTTLHTYTYHRLVLDESGVSNADALVTAFNETYYGPLSSNPATRPSGANRQNGDLYFNSSDGKMKVYNGSHASGTWDDVAAPGNFFINTLSSSSPILKEWLTLLLISITALAISFAVGFFLTLFFAI